MGHVRDVPGVQHVVGPDRDVAEVVERLRDGGSVIVVGALGSGKSFFARAVASRFQSLGQRPVLVRAAAPLAGIVFGALHASGDPRIERLWEGEKAVGADPLILIIDDANALDPASIDIVGRAIYTGQVRALLSVTSDPATGSQAIPPAITDLWLGGAAARYDLHQLDAGAAEELLTEFDPRGSIDSVARTVLAVRAGGSRMLLRELAVDALEEIEAGRDPLDPGREVPAGSRLSDAVAIALGGYTDELLLALALVGRLRGIEFATACLCIQPHLLETLIARKAIRADDTAAQGLFASVLLAQEAERRLAPGRLQEALDHTVRRALESPDLPAGRAIDRVIASNWLSRHPGVPGADEVDVAVRCRILSSAARSANGRGRADIALAYVRLGLETDGCPALHIEASRALARLGRIDDAQAELRRHAPCEIPTPDLRRLVRWWGSLAVWMPGAETLDAIETWLRDGGVDDPSVLCELDVHRAELACLDVDWAAARTRAEAVLAVTGVHTLARLRSAIIIGLASAELGDRDTAARAFGDAARGNRDLLTGRSISVLAELAVICFEAIGSLVLARPMPAAVTRLREAMRLAAERDDRGAIALAGVVQGIVLTTTAAQDAEAVREFAAALRRFDRIEFAAWRPIVMVMQASCLARSGRLAQARAVAESIDESQLARHRLYRSLRLGMQAELLHAQGDFAGAAAAVQAAIDERSLGGEAPATSELERQTLARFVRAAETGAPVPGITLDLDSGGLMVPSPAGDGGGSTSGAGRHDAVGFTGAAGPATTTDAAPELTGREHEIALLVARQLSNKEIAQRLFLSVRTVESHVYTARGKLGARSRRELGRLVAGAEIGAVRDR